MVQGGTFYNKAVLRAFEKLLGMNVTCPDISGIMGAFGAALIAKERYTGTGSRMLSFEQIANLTYTTTSRRCGGCQNNCMLTFNRFSSGVSHMTGNRCEKAVLNEKDKGKLPNLVAYKQRRIFDYPPLDDVEAKRGVIGIPRVLNMYENYPFWATFFKALGFRVILSPFSSRKIYELGMESIPSESECYPAKLAHGHIEWLIKEGVKTIFHPCVYYEKKEHDCTQNKYNCPMVISYAENLKNNVESLTKGGIRYLRPFLSLADEKTVCKRMMKFCREEWNIPEAETKSAVAAAWMELNKAKADILNEGKSALHTMKLNAGRGIVLCGRPYHIDPEINHGIPELIHGLGFYVFTEDSLPTDLHSARQLRALDQWVYHSRLYSAAEFVRGRDDLEIIQLNSFGCGLDAVTTDQMNEILEASGKLYTVLKIDEISNLGAIRIRIRSLIAAMNMRKKTGITAKPAPVNYQRAEYTKQMQEENYTILAPQMSPIHFEILEPVFKKHGYNLEILRNDNREAIDTGLKYVNNDACFPSVTMVGQFMHAIKSGKYDTDKLALLMTQTGGCCRASNYVSFIRRALDKEGLTHIPVISLNFNGMEKNEGFKISLALLKDAAHALVYGDLLMRCLYRVRPYEMVKGSANELHKKWREICIDSITNPESKYKYADTCRTIVNAFDKFPIDDSVKKPRVGIVGEILVKYMPLANNHLVDVLEREGAEVVVPDLVDFFNYTAFGSQYKHLYLGGSNSEDLVSRGVLKLIASIRKPAVEALKNSNRFETPLPINEIAEMTKPYLSLGNMYGEGWFLAGEMLELINHGTPNIVCIQPFACLPNHVVGKGVIKAIKTDHRDANIVAVDYDPGASEVNQLNRIKLMLTTAKRNLE